MRVEEPQPVSEYFGGYPQFVGRFEGIVRPLEHVDEGIPGDEFLGCESACCLFFSRVVTVRVPEVDVCLLVLDGAASLDLQQVLVEPDGVVAVCGGYSSVVEPGEVQDNAVPAFT